MPVARLHRLTTICLAAVYGAVGLTGSSLYYLITDFTTESANSPSDEAVVYFHTHGPGEEGHFHRHIVHRHLSGATTALHHKSRRGTYDVAIAVEGPRHQPHSCAILT